MDVMNKGRADGADTETERDGWYEPARAEVFTSHVGRYLEDDVRDVEDGENDIVIITPQAQVFLESSEFGITHVGAIDEAKEVE